MGDSSKAWDTLLALYVGGVYRTLWLAWEWKGYVRSNMNVAGVYMCVMGRSMSVCVRASFVVPYSKLPFKCTESPFAVEVRQVNTDRL